jgi:hypothetical protein
LHTHYLVNLPGEVVLRRILAGSILIATLALFSFAANAAGFGSREEAVAMIKRVQEKFKKDSAQATFAAIKERLGDRYAAGVGIYKDEQTNRNTVSIISGSPSSDSACLQVAYDLAAALNDGENLRVLPVVGIGGPQNIRDVRTLKGIAIILPQFSILNNFRRANEILGIHDKIVHIAKLFNMEEHVVVRPDIKSLEQLQGQK